MGEFETELRRIVREELAQALDDARLPKATEEHVSSLGRYLTVKEAAALASVSKGTIQAWLNARKLRRCGAGRVVRIKLSDLVELMEGRCDDDEEMDEVAARVGELMERYPDDEE